ncbi:MAG: hypothetical protein R3C10_15665 [Pirellulales bacterium]
MTLRASSYPATVYDAFAGRWTTNVTGSIRSEADFVAADFAPVGWAVSSPWVFTNGLAVRGGALAILPCFVETGRGGRWSSGM